MQERLCCVPEIQSGAHHHNTRKANNLALPIATRWFASKSIRFSIPTVYNNCTENIKSKMLTHSIEWFSNYIKTDIISTKLIFQKGTVIVNPND